MKDCPTCGGSGKVPDDYTPSGRVASGRPGAVPIADHRGMCSCDGPSHLWDPTWCPPGGPVTHGR